jgi:hypothetical protein
MGQKARVSERLMRSLPLVVWFWSDLNGMVDQAVEIDASLGCKTKICKPCFPTAVEIL